MKLLILARDYQSFRRWCVKAGIAPFDCTFVAGVEDLRDNLNQYSIVIAVEGWSSNPEYDSVFFHSVLAKVNPKIVKAI